MKCGHKNYVMHTSFSFIMSIIPFTKEKQSRKTSKPTHLSSLNAQTSTSKFGYHLYMDIMTSGKTRFASGKYTDTDTEGNPIYDDLMIQSNQIKRL